MQFKSNEMALKIGIQDFKCSVSYTENWRKRLYVVWGKILGEATAISGTLRNNFTKKRFE